MDYSTYPDVDEAFAPLNEQQAIAQVCARRLETPRGTLRTDPNFGFDCRTYVLGKVDQTVRMQLRTEIAAELVKDERVKSARVTVEHTAGTLTIKVELTTSVGPFTLLLSVSQLSVTILRGAS